MTHMKEPEGAAMARTEPEFTSIEICAGAGGQAIGLHQAGFGHLALVEIDQHAVDTLRLNIDDHEVWSWERENCDVLSADVKEFEPFRDLSKGAELLKPEDLDLLAAWVPCPRSPTQGSNSARTTSETSFRACWNWSIPSGRGR